MAGHGEQQPRVLGGDEVQLGQVVSNLRLQVVQSEQGRVRTVPLPGELTIRLSSSPFWILSGRYFASFLFLIMIISKNIQPNESA